jgi:hypothetical protein
MRILSIAALAALAVPIFGGCLTRPVTSGDPSTKAVFFDELSQTAIDKVDLLFAIDNSASMGDKQDLLAAAVPVLVNRLLNPNCVDTSVTCKAASECTAALGASAECDTSANQGAGACFVAGDNMGGANQCSSIPNTKPEFPPVHDLHVAIVSSSMGGGGSPDLCAPIDASDSTHQDDHGWLLNRTTTNTPVANANPVTPPGGNFLAWLPPSDPKNAGKAPPNVTPYTTSSTQLVSDFQSLVSGVQQHGCGLEAQLESWYHFLVQPDPWQSVALGDGNRASYQGVDSALLKMRHDFLRPDSLVAIIQLTDEEDSWSDPMWAGGFGWVARTQSFPGGPDSAGTGPRGTHECDTNPNDPDCTSCAFAAADPSAKKASGALIKDDPSCTSCPAGVNNCKPGWYVSAQSKPAIAAADGLNVRYSEQLMKRRYGFDSQHNVQRYIDGLRSTTVPDRDHESHDHDNYAPQRNCTNPLFAIDLPDGSDTSPDTLCKLKSVRPPDHVFYALIGGVPNDLVDGNPQWSKILGADPEHGDTTGIDPRMIESMAPRAGVQGEWNTLSSSAFIDYQYACTFDLPKQRVCAPGDSSCDCQGAADGPPLCSSAGSTTQVKGKAYPTIRELRVAKGLGDQAVVASLCAKVVSGSTSDPSYGYNPAMQAIVSRLKKQLAQQCLPQKLVRDTAGDVPCLVLAEYKGQTDQAAGCTDPGMCNPADPTTCGCKADDVSCIATYKNILSRYQQGFQASLGDGGASQPTPVACIFQQIADPACSKSQGAGWCYVEGAANTGGCPQAIQFAGSGPPNNVTISLECIE